MHTSIQGTIRIAPNTETTTLPQIGQKDETKQNKQNCGTSLPWNTTQKIKQAKTISGI